MPMTDLGQSVARRPKVGMLVLKPLPGERRKSSELLLVWRPWRSKWARVECMGSARACVVGECRHVRYVCERYRRCRPQARKERD
jgi:hypothetical protein